MAAPPSDGPWDHLSHGENDGGFAEILRTLMLYLGFHHQPIFRGRKTTIEGRESWTMEVYLSARIGEFVAYTFQAEAPRRSSLDAVQDAARFACARLCWTYEDLLLGSPFYFFPYVRDGEHIPAIFDARDNDPRLTHQVQLTQAMATTVYSDMVEINQLWTLLIGSYADSDTLRTRLSESEEARFAAIWERDTVTTERDTALAEVARLTAALASTTFAPVPVPPPAVPSSDRTLNRPLRPRGARTRMTARKSVRRPSPPPFDDLPVSRHGRSPSRSPHISPSRSHSTSFSQSRSRSDSPME